MQKPMSKCYVMD